MTHSGTMQASEAQRALAYDLGQLRRADRFQDAIDLWEEQQDQPGFVADSFLLTIVGDCHLGLRDINKAEPYFKQALDLNIKDSFAWRGYTRCAELRNNDQKEIEARFGEAVTHCPGDVIFIQKWANYASRNGDNEEADKRLSLAFERFPCDTRIIHSWGRVALKMDNLEEASRRFAIGMQVDPRDRAMMDSYEAVQFRIRNAAFTQARDVVRNMRELQASGQAQEAIAIGERWVAEHGNNPYVMCQTGYGYLSLGEFDKAERSINPNDADHFGECLRLLGNVAYERGDYVTAVQKLEIVSEKFPNIPANEEHKRAVRAWSQEKTLEGTLQKLRKTDVNEAIRLGEAWLDEGPSLAIICELGLCYAVNGEQDKADALHEKYKQRFDHPKLYYFHALVPQHGQHDYTLAEERFREAIARFPDYSHIYGRIGAVIARQGKFADAADFLHKAHKKFPNDSGILSELAKAMYGTLKYGDDAYNPETYRDVVSYARQSITLKPEYNLEAYMVLGQVADKVRDAELAREVCDHFQQYDRLKPVVAEIYGRLQDLVARRGGMFR